jgi:hypothetical protein
MALILYENSFKSFVGRAEDSDTHSEQPIGKDFWGLFPFEYQHNPIYFQSKYDIAIFF